MLRSITPHVLVPTLVMAALAVGCGRPTAGKNKDLNPLGNGDGDFCGQLCIDATECGGNPCIGGFCDCGGTSGGDTVGGDTNTTTGPTECETSADCKGNTFCHFPSSWTPGTKGTCEGLCSSDPECGIDQICDDGRCYTQIECNPQAPECPPGEVCDGQSQRCSPPPDTCYFTEQCPAGWVCNTDNTCIDPNDVNLGGCSIDDDCGSLPECANTGGANACECDAGECRPINGCTTAADCGAGNYCASGACQPAQDCSGGGQNDCTPYGLVCESNYCINPEPCAADGSCPNGYECNENIDGCFPPDTADCTRDDQCPAGKYCELFTGTCQNGCRSNADCTSVAPYCGQNHACQTTSTGQVGDPCSDNNECPGGTVCAVDDPGIMGLTCQMFGDITGTGSCTKSCRVACDTLTSKIINTCPPGEQCGSGDLFEDLIAAIFGGSMGGGGTNASVCYPAPQP